MQPVNRQNKLFAPLGIQKQRRKHDEYFVSHLDNARHFMQMQGYVPNMPEKSRYCRRLHRRADFLLTMFYAAGKQLKDIAGKVARFFIAFAFDKISHLTSLAT